MKRITILILLIALMVSGCTTGGTTQEPGEDPAPQESQESAEEPKEIPQEEQEDSDDPRYDPAAHQIFREAYDDAVTVLFWYFSDPSADLLVEMDDPESTDSYRKVGRFDSEEAMREATSRSFTPEFSDTFFYDHAFQSHTGGEPMYIQREDGLYRNVDMGGFGWPYSPTEDFEVALFSDDLLVLSVRTQVHDEEQWFYHILKREDGVWKFHRFYDFTPYSVYEEQIASAVSAWLCTRDWDDPNALDASQLITFYADQFVPVGTGYNDEAGYAVPAAEVLANLSNHFDGLVMETLTKLADEQYASAEYDPDGDRFLFELTRDPASFVIVDQEDSGDGATTLQVLVIAKSGQASYWGYLTVEESESGVRYLSNRFVDIPGE